MAEGTIVSFAKKLAVITVEEYKFLQGVEGQVVSLRDELQWISSFLRDAAVQRSNYERVDVWVSQIRDLSYDAEDVLDLFIHKVKRLRERSWLRFMPEWLNCPGPPVTLHNLGNQISSINSRIGNISAYKSRYAIDKLNEKDSLGKDVTFNRSKAPSMEEEVMFGFKDQLEEVKRMLSIEQKGDDASKLHVVSIVGMAGTGKSTLAYKVYKDIKNQFDSCAWVYVSQEFESHRVLQLIKEQNSKDTDYGKLLVVFDDVWREKDWDSIYKCLLQQICIDRKESRVLITSRFDSVANRANSDTHKIKELEEKESLDLLRWKVFHDQDFPKGLEKIAKQIIDKCNRLPLAIVVMGGLLSTKQRTIDVWTKVVKNAKWQLLQGSTECFEVLDLSYENLPNHLKPCFLYFGLFPEDCPINCETLIQLWIAEGFIEEKGEESMEDVAEDCLEDLIQRNVIQVDKRRSNGSLATCKIHDLWREYAISKGRHDKFLEVLGNKRLPNRCIMSRRLGIYSTGGVDAEREGTAMPDGSSLNNPRSILCFTNLRNKQLEKTSFYEDFTYLRVLDLQGAAEMESIPDAIGKLVLLKYLNLHNTQVRRLPSSIRKLQSLQTLDISETQIVGIPLLVWELEELRHFYANLKELHSLMDPEFIRTRSCCDLLGKICCDLEIICDNFCYDPLGMIYDDFSCYSSPQIGRLTNLQTLSTRGGNWINKDFFRLVDLRKLKITGVNIELYGGALTESILKFIYLRELEIEWNNGKLKFKGSLSQHIHLYKMQLSGPMQEISNVGEVFPPFPPNLIELELSNTELKPGGDFMRVLAKLENLQILHLRTRSLVEDHMVFPKDGFPKLTKLDLELLSDLKGWTMENESLPKLKVLNLKSLDNLRKLPDGFDQVISKLQKLKLLAMPSEFSESVERYKSGDVNIEIIVG